MKIFQKFWQYPHLALGHGKVCCPNHSLPRRLQAGGLQKILLCAGIALTIGNLPSTAETDARPDLTGSIVETDGTPIAKATVFIYTAGPKKGTSSLCPCCYPDCQKKVQSDADGQFKIESLDPTLLFRLLVLAGGHESQFVTKIDPAKGSQKIVMKPLSQEDLQSDLRIKGMVIDAQGKPVPGAVIDPEGVGYGSSTRWGGNDDAVEPLAVAGEDGHFVLFCKTNNIDAIYAIANGRGAAQKWITLKPGGDYLVRLPEGVTLTGTVVRDGQPVKGASIAATTKDRTCGVYFNCDAVSTDKNGRFRLLNVPPDREFVVSSTMSSLHDNGALPNKIITTGESGSVQDLGELAVEPAFTIAGRIVLSDGQSIPPDTRLFLGREEATDSAETKLAADGRFEFKGLPKGSITLAVRIKGYRMSKQNPSLDWLNGQIIGKVSEDVNDLNVLMEPGQWQFNNQEDRPAGVEEYPVNEPLRGVKL